MKLDINMYFWTSQEQTEAAWPFFYGDFVMKIYLGLFRWFKSSCLLLAKECAKRTMLECVPVCSQVCSFCTSSNFLSQTSIMEFFPQWQSSWKNVFRNNMLGKKRVDWSSFVLLANLSIQAHKVCKLYCLGIFWRPSVVHHFQRSWPIKAKFHVEHPWGREQSLC